MTDGNSPYDVNFLDDDEIKQDHIPDITIDSYSGTEVEATFLEIGPDGKIIKKVKASEKKKQRTKQKEQKTTPLPDSQIFTTPLPKLDISPDDFDYPLEQDYSAFPLKLPKIKEVDDITNLVLTEDLYPAETGFFPLYLKYTQGTADSPLPFHFASGLAVLSHCISDRYDCDFLKMRPNVGMLLIGGSGDRKSRAMDLAIKLLAQDTIHSGSISSGGAFVQKLKKNPKLLWHLDEADVFFQTVAAAGHTPSGDLAARIASAFTGADQRYESLTQGSIQSEDPSLSILMGTALEWLEMRKLSPAFLRGGLFARIWLIPAKRDRLLKFPPPPNVAAGDSLRDWFAALQAVDDATIRFSKEAKGYIGNYQTYKDVPAELAVCGAWGRAQAHVVKLAVLYHICQMRGPEQEIDAATSIMAIKFVHQYLMPGYLWAMKKLEAAGDCVSDIEQRILSLLDTAGVKGLPVRQLQSSFGRRINSMEAMINLHRKHKVRFYANIATKGRPSRIVVSRKFDKRKKPVLYSDDKTQALPNFIKRVAELED